MPDIIIKDMEMPENCFDCVTRYTFFRELHCDNLKGMAGPWVALPYKDSRHPDCPLYPAPEWHDVTDPPKRDGSYYATRHSVYGDFQTLLDYSVADDSWFEYDADYEDDFGILEHDDVVRWHDLPEPLDGGGGE